MSEEKLTRAAIVTGGSRGIGRAVCVALAKQGCNVVVNYCHGAEPAEQTAALCRAEGVQAVTVQADVSTAGGCKALFDAAAEAFGRVDVLVNNAGITRDGLLLRMSEADFDAVLDANLKGAFLCCKEAARRTHPPERPSSNLSGRRCKPSPTAKPAPTDISPCRSATTNRSAPSAWPTTTTRSRSSSPATASSARTARSRAMPAGWRLSESCWRSRGSPF